MSGVEPRFELLRQIVDALPVAVALHVGGVGGRTSFVNSRFVALFGYDQTQVADLEAWWLGACPDPTYRDGLRNEWRRRIAHAAASGRAAEPLDTHVSCIDGSVRDVEIHLTPVGEAIVVTFIDVSRRKRTEATLRDYQARLDLTLASAKAAYWELDIASGTHKPSPNYYGLLGYAAVDAPRNRAGWLALLHADDVAEIERRQQATLPMGAEGRSEFRIRASDGTWRWLLSHFRAVGDSSGAPVRLIGIDLDITARKQAELALQAARDQAQQYLDIAGVIFVALDLGGAITLLNRRGCDVLQVGEGSILGRNWYDVFAPPAERLDQKAKYRTFVSGARGEQEEVELPTLTGRGELRLIRWHGVLLRDQSGQVVGSLSSGEDVTAQRAAERKRDEARALIAATAEASPDGILVTDRDGRYLFWNNRLREMWGLDDDYLRLRQSEPGIARELLAPYLSQLEDPESFVAQTANIYGSGSRPPIAGDLFLADGRVFTSYAARVASGGPLSAVAWICRDITDQKRRDAELAQSQRLNAVGELSGGVAHDFNNLLTIIGGNLELLLQHVAGDGAAARFAETALVAVQRGAELTQRLLAFSRQQPLAPQLTDVNRLVGEMLEILPRLLGEAIEIEFRPAAGLWPTIVDPGQLQTALINLASNARDAMPSGGVVTVATGNRVVDSGYADSVAELRAGGYVEIAVADQGTGMPPDVARRAFEPFFTTKPVGQGTGLGLSMVFGFVKQSGGHVAIDGAGNPGTTVRILLPRAAGEARAALPRPAAGLRQPGMTVLLVEDEPAVSGVARAFLEDLDWRVLEARNGPQALALLRDGPPADLLFTDVILPGGMSGPDVAAAALALRPGLKVLYASGYAREALARGGQLDLEVVLLQKPYRKCELAEAIDRVLAGA